MGVRTTIGWTDYTFNPWIGCSKVSAGCANCYAEADFDKRRGVAKWGAHGTRVKTSESYWQQPVKWNRDAAKGVPVRLEPSRKQFTYHARYRVFCASLADVFEDWPGPILSPGRQGIRLSKQGRASTGVANRMTIADLRNQLCALIDATPHLDWLLLTKRPENVPRMWPPVSVGSQQQADDRNERGELYRRNVWLLTSVENQETADARVPHLLACRDLAPVLGLSCEPLLGPIDLQAACTKACPNRDCWPAEDSRRLVQDSTEGGLCIECYCSRLNGLDWVIGGGESGPGYRPMEVAWLESLAEQCSGAGVPFFCKQDSGGKSSQQGRLSQELWARKEFPRPFPRWEQ